MTAFLCNLIHLNTIFAMKKVLSLLLLIAQPALAQQSERLEYAATIERSIHDDLLNRWYPQAIDTLYGGFLTTFTYDFNPTEPQNKFIVTQARHTWSNALASMLYPKEKHFLAGARHGFTFLQQVMWDSVYGGFNSLVTR